KGDTVFGIAHILGVPPDKLESLNNNQLARRGLRIGQKITVPVPGGRKQNVSVRIEKERYKVKRGDSLTLIARKYGTSVRALKSWNHSIPANGSLKAGQSLYIHHAVVDINKS
ncbi:MAG: LysM peptidoglycan-binding domain-containing protein, partial [Gemmatimonadota bacterium]|nr:LysM peptidoglycan-binding domain-containing protein [Gemmatimonadota bacterium]